MEYKVILIDATDTLIERPKKKTKKNSLIQAARKKNQELSSKMS